MVSDIIWFTLLSVRWLSLNPCCNGRWSLTPQKSHCEKEKQKVLILVVMEDGLWLLNVLSYSRIMNVLILVVMEDGLWRVSVVCIWTCPWRVNPCCNGRWSLTCFIWSGWGLIPQVLILVVMEDGLWRYVLCRKGEGTRVLILVVMEDGLWPAPKLFWAAGNEWS